MAGWKSDQEELTLEMPDLSAVWLGFVFEVVMLVPHRGNSSRSYNRSILVAGPVRHNNVAQDSRSKPH